MSRRKRQQEADRKGIILLGSVILLLVVGISVFYFYVKPTVKRDSETACRIDKKVPRETVVIIDATDNFNETQALRIKKQIELMLSSAITDERFSLYVLDETIGQRSQKFSVCNPGDGSNKSELTSNKRRIKKNWENQFYNRFTTAVDELTVAHTAIQSPILEMIKFVSVNTFLDSPAINKRLIIVSDMLHHTQQYSHYLGSMDYTKFSKTSYALAMQPLLEGVDVQIFYLIREKNISLQNRGHIEFWNQHILVNNGFVSSVKTVN
ncbi:hypothetical protein BJAS_P3622 [Bathymodiolus japonicus methanotrophic gill symbiont]|uniref:hypothetical protein n=1 Tax=Bathymodiolus japonicus methanotrophic gill symbiont TaxID=113269 RepID=UPI001B65EB77|nr:hypothetical protein [Bathymodiolus japonicus methanotrophic gill symbiont]GFO73047.1 hypothetical protein BJAS_P3622 [Bathymodiolus japonicus methanotrophic gill symbiont]